MCYFPRLLVLFIFNLCLCAVLLTTELGVFLCSHMFSVPSPSRGLMHFVALPPWLGWCTYTTTWGDEVWSSPWQTWMLCPPSILPTEWVYLQSGNKSKSNTYTYRYILYLSTRLHSLCLHLTEYPGKRDSWDDPCHHSSTSATNSSPFQRSYSEYFTCSPAQWRTTLTLCRTGTSEESRHWLIWTEGWCRLWYL